ncbi:MAG: hypothetical protein KAG61_05670 [Bacteriovoracaceae bacterium]|nr:hypothetical protein [Bacteriovoracaceae bacterium]
MKWTLLLLFILTNTALAAVWEDELQWSQEWETQYSNWVKSELKSDIFTNPKSQFYGLETDCTDFVIAQRIIFSYINKLPFYSGGTQHNRSTRFDSVDSETNRVIAFINDITDSHGSYFLANNLSYSIPLDEIRSGDIFVYREKSGSFHSYLIKDLQENGNFELWYSTTPKAVRTLIKRIGMPAKPTTARPYGFRRLKMPSQVDMILSLPREYNQQYDLLRQLGPHEAMTMIKKLVRKRKETLKEAVERRVANSCELIKSRINNIRMTNDMFNRTGFRCLNKAEYYNYSTPSLDQVLYESVVGLAKLWLKVKEHGRETELKNNTMEIALDYLTGKHKSTEAKKELKNICKVSIPIDFRQYALRYKRGVLSSNPHRHITTRWGAKRTNSNTPWDLMRKCKAL